MGDAEGREKGEGTLGLVPAENRLLAGKRGN